MKIVQRLTPGRRHDIFDTMAGPSPEDLCRQLWTSLNAVRTAMPYGARVRVVMNLLGTAGNLVIQIEALLRAARELKDAKE